MSRTQVADILLKAADHLEASIKVDGLPDTFWIITKASPETDMLEDIMFEASFDSLMLQTRGGLNEDDIIGVFKTKTAAKKAAMEEMEAVLGPKPEMTTKQAASAAKAFLKKAARQLSITDLNDMGALRKTMVEVLKAPGSYDEKKEAHEILVPLVNKLAKHENESVKMYRQAHGSDSLRRNDDGRYVAGPLKAAARRPNPFLSKKYGVPVFIATDAERALIGVNTARDHGFEPVDKREVDALYKKVTLHKQVEVPDVIEMTLDVPLTADVQGSGDNEQETVSLFIATRDGRARVSSVSRARVFNMKVFDTAQKAIDKVADEYEVSFERGVPVKYGDG